MNWSTTEHFDKFSQNVHDLHKPADQKLAFNSWSYATPLDKQKVKALRVPKNSTTTTQERCVYLNKSKSKLHAVISCAYLHELLPKFWYRSQVRTLLKSDILPSNGCVILGHTNGWCFKKAIWNRQTSANHSVGDVFHNLSICRRLWIPDGFFETTIRTSGDGGNRKSAHKKKKTGRVCRSKLHKTFKTTKIFTRSSQ